MVRRQLLFAATLFAVVAVVVGCGTSTPSLSAEAPSGTASQAAPTAATGAPTTSPDAAPTASPGPTEPIEYQASEDLRVGDCYEPVEDADDQTLLAAIIVPCEVPHPHEVFGLGELAGGDTAPFPGLDAVDDDAIDLCDAAFESYVGVAIDNSQYSYVYYTPTEESWAGGDRVVMCSVEHRRQLIEGSVEGTER